MTKQMVRELILIQMELNTLDSGKMTNKMDLESKNGLMGRNMKDNTKMVQKLVKAYLNF